MKNQKIISIVIALILLGGISYFVYQDLANSDSSLKTIATTTPDGKGQIISGGGDVEGSLPNADAPVPNLDRKFVIPDIYSEDIIKNTMEQYSSLVSALKKDPTLRREWLQLAILRNTIEDYEGAEEIWIYVTLRWPLDHVAFGNLGNLYLDFLKDEVKAEKFLRLALEKSPITLQYSENLYNLYRFRQETPEKAISLILLMKQNFPEQVYFPLKAAEHYRDTGDEENAKKFFEESRDIAVTSKQQNVVDYANTELEKLK